MTEEQEIIIGDLYVRLHDITTKEYNLARAFELIVHTSRIDSEVLPALLEMIQTKVDQCHEDRIKISNEIDERLKEDEQEDDDEEDNEDNDEEMENENNEDYNKEHNDEESEKD